MEAIQKFVLIDGNAILHRAYHALPPLTNKKGEVVNAVYGFCSMLLKIIEDLRPSYIAVCFDREAPNFRQSLYAGYQGQRPKMAEDLTPQIGMVHEVLEKMKVKVFEIDGYEADDLIGTIAHRVVARGPASGLLPASAPLVSPPAGGTERVRAVGSPSTQVTPRSEIDVIIVSGDRDMLQLINSHVRVLAPVVGITNMILYDDKKVQEKYGLLPSQIVDYKALVGDASDNYPGISGIGPKTASELLKKYHTFENLYQHIGDVPPKIAEKLAVDAEQASLAKKLATIVTDAPASFSIEQCSMLHFDKKGARAAFENLGFKSLVKRLVGSEEPKKTASVQKSKKEEGQLGLL